MKRLALPLVLPLLVLSCKKPESDGMKPKESSDKLSVTSFSPKEGRLGTEVSLLGSAYGTDMTKIVVHFHDGKMAKMVEVQDGKIVVIVPEGATTGRVRITKDAETVETKEDFTVIKTSSQNPQNPPSKPPKITTRAEFLKDFETNYLVGRTEENWTGNATECQKGDISASSREKSLKRLNYFRRQTGLKEPLKLSDELNAKCQASALIMKANGHAGLTHHPSPSLKCYTQEGKEAAIGNLYFSGAPRSNFLASAITKFMQDHGEHNQRVGHRTWFLHPSLEYVGIGATNQQATIWWSFKSAGIGEIKDLPKFVSWPPKGFVAIDLVFKRWSFHLLEKSRGDDIEQASVRMRKKNSNQDIPLSVIHQSNIGKLGMLTLVWQLTNLELPTGTGEGNDISYVVTVSDVGVVEEGAKKMQTFEYEVVIVKTKNSPNVNFSSLPTRPELSRFEEIL